ncbi:hypothetical protein C8R45DRAFT_928989 [Mycena sanguinolenta]|nr:hypothetical protein C8R45DRAFT_928989 [Mycena sanguinolenta]
MSEGIQPPWAARSVHPMHARKPRGDQQQPVWQTAKTHRATAVNGERQQERRGTAVDGSPAAADKPGVMILRSGEPEDRQAAAGNGALVNRQFWRGALEARSTATGAPTNAPTTPPHEVIPH